MINFTILSNTKRFVVFLQVFFLSALLVVLLEINANIHQKDYASSTSRADKKQQRKIDLTNQATYQTLPVGSVETYSASQPAGTVIFIPQFHKYPGSDSSDKVNDSAVIAQQQIYDVLSFLVKNAKVPVVMTEGELVGEVPAEKIAKVAQKIEKLNNCVALYGKLKHELSKKQIDYSFQAKLFSKLDERLAAANREIILSGASIRLKAEGVPFLLTGSENKETQDLSRAVVKDYVYLQDRMDDITQSSEQKHTKNQLSQDSLRFLISILSKNDSLSSDFSILSQQAKKAEDDRLLTIINLTEKAFADLEENKESNMRTAENQILQKLIADEPTSRSDNPYQSITSIKKIETLIKKADEQIDKVVVKRRNVETAQNIANALKSGHSQAAVLQFGAGHKEDLVKELQKLDLTVIVVTPNQVLKN